MEKDKKSKELEQGIQELERKQSELKNDISKMKNNIYALSLERDALKTLVNYVVSKQQDSEYLPEENLFDLRIQKRVAIEEKEETKRLREIQNDIKVLEVMLAWGTVGLMDMQMMEEEIKELKKSEGAVGSAMEVKVGELVEGMWELKREIVQVLSRKNEELMSLVENEGGNIRKEKKDWYGVVLAVGVVVSFVVYKFFVGKNKLKGRDRK